MAFFTIDLDRIVELEEVLSALRTHFPGHRVGDADSSERWDVAVRVLHSQQRAASRIDGSTAPSVAGGEERSELGLATALAKHFACKARISAWGATLRAARSALIEVDPEGLRHVVYASEDDEDVGDDIGLVSGEAPQPWEPAVATVEVWATPSMPPRVLIVERSPRGIWAWYAPVERRGSPAFSCRSDDEHGEGLELDPMAELERFARVEGLVFVGRLPGTYEVG